VARQHHTHSSHERHAQVLYRGAVDHGLTSNPTIFDHAIRNGTAYDAAICQRLAGGRSGESLFFEIALEDLIQAADLFRPIHKRTVGVGGWVSFEVSPLPAHDTRTTLAEAKESCGNAPTLHRESRLLWRLR